MPVASWRWPIGSGEVYGAPEELPVTEDYVNLHPDGAADFERFVTEARDIAADVANNAKFFKKLRFELAPLVLALVLLLTVGRERHQSSGEARMIASNQWDMFVRAEFLEKFQELVRI